MLTLVLPIDTVTVIASYCDPQTYRQLALCNKKVYDACRSTAVILAVLEQCNYQCCYWRNDNLLEHGLAVRGALNVYNDICIGDMHVNEHTLERVLALIPLNTELLTDAARFGATRVFKLILSMHPDVLRDASNDEMEDVVISSIMCQRLGDISLTKKCFKTLGIDSINLGDLAYEAYLHACQYPFSQLLDHIKKFDGYDQLADTESFEYIFVLATKYMKQDTSIEVLQEFCSHASEIAFNNQMAMCVQSITEDVIRRATEMGDAHVRVIEQTSWKTVEVQQAVAGFLLSVSASWGIMDIP